MEKRIKIIIPTDFTVQGDYAYVMVQNLAKKMPLEVTFLHVLNVPDTVTMDKDGSIQTCGEIDIDYVEQQKEMAGNKMKALKLLHGDDIKTQIVLGKTTTGIVRFANDHSYDLIVMGTKGVSGITERVVGSEAQLVARKSSVPVLSLMCDRSDLELKKIVLVYDFKHHEKQNLSFLTTLMQVFNTEIHLLQIRNSQQLSEDEVKENMALFANNNEIENYVTHVLKESDVEQGVIHFNQMNNMDMVWVGTHGTGGLFHSSAAEALINHMFKPVVSFRIK